MEISHGLSKLLKRGKENGAFVSTVVNFPAFGKYNTTVYIYVLMVFVRLAQLISK